MIMPARESEKPRFRVGIAEWKIFCKSQKFWWLPRRGSRLFEIIWMISHRTYFPLFPSLFFFSSAKNILIQILFPFPSLFFISSKRNLFIIILLFSPPHLHHISPPTTYISFSFFVILLLCKQINVWIKSRNCVGHFVLFMQYVVKCTMSWFTHSIRKIFV